MMNEDIAKDLIDQIKGSGELVLQGLNANEIQRIEDALGAKFPPDLKILFMQGIPVGSDENHQPFPDWHGDPDRLVVDMKTDIEMAFSSDIEEGEYWHDLFGSRPEDDKSAVSQALDVIRTWPPLVRVYGHRFMATNPCEQGNPIFSVWSADDTVYYGFNLIDYLGKEFDIKANVGTGVVEPRKIPIWSEVFNLQD